MSGISSISSWSGVPYPAPTTKAHGSYEANAANYGPAVASAIGLAGAAGDAVGTVCSFSAESLERLSEAAKAGLSSVGDALGEAITDTGTAIGDAAGDVQQGLSDFAGGVSTLVDKVESSFGSAADAVADAVSSAADNVGSAASNAAAYLTLGMAAGRQVLSEVA